MSEATEAHRRKYSRRVIELAVSRVFGTTTRDACRITQVSERAAYKWLAAHRDEVEEVIEFITPLIKETRQGIMQVAAAEFKGEMDKRLGKVVEVIDDGLDKETDIKDRLATAAFAASYSVGKPANKHVIEGDITHTQVYAIDPGTLAVLNKIASGSGPLYDSAKALASPQKLLNG